MASTRIQLCGPVVVELDGRRIESELPGRQGRLLFVYLTVTRARASSRDDLVDAIWPDSPPPNVESSLSALLSKLRRSVELEGRSAVRVVFPSDAWVDLEAAADALHRAESSAARAEWPDVWGPARVTQHIAARGFLAGEDAPWVRETRSRVETMEVRALELVADACLAIGGGEIATAERAARRLVEKAPFREGGYRALMRALDVRQNRAEALQVYERLRVLLRDELGTTPSRATQELHRELLG